MGDKHKNDSMLPRYKENFTSDYRGVWDTTTATPPPPRPHHHHPDQILVTEWEMISWQIQFVKKAQGSQVQYQVK